MTSVTRTDYVGPLWRDLVASRRGTMNTSTSTSVNKCNCYIFRRIFRTATHVNERTFGLKRIGILIQRHYLQSKSEHRSFVIFRKNTDE